MPFALPFAILLGGPPPGSTGYSLAPNFLSTGSTGLGIDLLAGSDLDPRMLTVEGIPCLAQDLTHHFSTVNGTLIDDPDFGLDLRDSVDKGYTQAQFAALQPSIANEALKDPRVQSCTALAVFNSQTSTLTVTLTITSALGPFTLVLAVTAVTVSLLGIKTA